MTLTLQLRLPGREGESLIDCGPCACGGVKFHVTVYSVPTGEQAEDGEIVCRREGRIVCERAGCVKSKNAELVVGVMDVSDGSFLEFHSPKLRSDHAIPEADERAPASTLGPDGEHDPFPGFPDDQPPGSPPWGVYVPDPRDQEYHRRKLQEAQSKEAAKQKRKLAARRGKVKGPERRRSQGRRLAPAAGQSRLIEASETIGIYDEESIK